MVPICPLQVCTHWRCHDRRGQRNVSQSSSQRTHHLKFYGEMIDDDRSAGASDSGSARGLRACFRTSLDSYIRALTAFMLSAHPPHYTCLLASGPYTTHIVGAKRSRNDRNSVCSDVLLGCHTPTMPIRRLGSCGRSKRKCTPVLDDPALSIATAARAHSPWQPPGVRRRLERGEDPIIEASLSLENIKCTSILFEKPII